MRGDSEVRLVALLFAVEWTELRTRQAAQDETKGCPLESFRSVVMAMKESKL